MKEVVITSSVLIVVLLVLRVIFAKKVRRAWIYGAWLLVALRLLIPVQIGQLPISMLTPVQPMTDAITEISQKQVAGVTEQDAYRKVLQEYIEEDMSVFTPKVQRHIQNAQNEHMAQDEIAEMLDDYYDESEIYVPDAQTESRQKAEDAVFPITLGQIATVVWLAGVAIMVIWLTVGNLLFVRSLRKSENPLTCESPIPVFVSGKAVTPCLVGLFRPAVYLTPESAADENVMRHVLAHELTHYAHKDHIWALIRCVCLCVYWFHPLVWVAAWFSRRDCELACDEGAMKHLDENQRIEYGKALLQVVSHTAVSGRLMLTATTMAETKKQLRQRINYIIRTPKFSITAAICMALVCALVAGCAAIGPAKTPENAPPSPVPAVQADSRDISQEMKSRIKKEYLVNLSSPHPNCTPEDVNLEFISRVDSGYALVIGCKCSSIDPNASWDNLLADSAGNLLFYAPNGWYFSFYKGGSFNRLNVAYNSGWLTYDELRTIWDDYHTQFPLALETWMNCHPGLNEPPERDPSGLDYAANDDGLTCTVTGLGVCNTKNVVIPEYIDGYRVTFIGDGAFQATEITSVTVADSVLRIERSAFSNCRKLQTVALGSRLESIGVTAFAYCPSLRNVKLPQSLTSIGDGAFNNCTSLRSITIPDGVTALSAGTFTLCENLSELILPESITVIHYQAVAACQSLTALTYKGTATQWESITLDAPWGPNNGECTVHCSDKTIVEKYEDRR